MLVKRFEQQVASHSDDEFASSRNYILSVYETIIDIRYQRQTKPLKLFVKLYTYFYNVAFLCIETYASVI